MSASNKVRDSTRTVSFSSFREITGTGSTSTILNNFFPAFGWMWQVGLVEVAREARERREEERRRRALGRVDGQTEMEGLLSFLHDGLV